MINGVFSGYFSAILAVGLNQLINTYLAITAGTLTFSGIAATTSLLYWKLSNHPKESEQASPSEPLLVNTA